MMFMAPFKMAGLEWAVDQLIYTFSAPPEQVTGKSILHEFEQEKDGSETMKTTFTYHFGNGHSTDVVVKTGKEGQCTIMKSITFAR